MHGEQSGVFHLDGLRGLSPATVCVGEEDVGCRGEGPHAGIRRLSPLSSHLEGSRFLPCGRTVSGVERACRFPAFGNLWVSGCLGTKRATESLSANSFWVLLGSLLGLPNAQPPSPKRISFAGIFKAGVGHGLPRG